MNAWRRALVVLVHPVAHVERYSLPGQEIEEAFHAGLRVLAGGAARDG